MSKQGNKAVIGAFVVGAVVLAVTGVLVFGSGKFFSETNQYVMYFDGSVKGLNIGSPVMFRGVKIGAVTNIVLRSNPEEATIEIPVFVEIERNRFQRVGKKPGKRNVHEEAEELVELGLRAQLQMKSMVTGQLMVELDFHPDKPAKLVGSDRKYPEIPTIKTGLQQFTQTLQDLPIEEMVNNLTSALEGIERAVNSPEVATGMNNINESLEDIQRLAKSLDRTVVENAELPYYFTKAMEEVSAAARSVRVLADYLEQNPDALIRGKGLPGGSN
jgi:paraquat-inducible protein B